MDIKITSTSKDNQKIEVEFKEINGEELEQSLFERIMKIIDNKDNQLYKTSLNIDWGKVIDKALGEKVNKN